MSEVAGFERGGSFGQIESWIMAVREELPIYPGRGTHCKVFLEGINNSTAGTTQNTVVVTRKWRVCGTVW
jgi:hypothetical protein